MSGMFWNVCENFSLILCCAWSYLTFAPVYVCSLSKFQPLVLQILSLLKVDGLTGNRSGEINNIP